MSSPAYPSDRRHLFPMSRERVVTGTEWGLRWQQLLTGALGLVWLTDAALQYQPYMFTRAFPRDVIAPTGDGNPSWIHGPVNWSATLMAHHIVILNALFATVQLLIGLGLFLRRTVKLALVGSIVWSLMVWWLGEGLGGILTGAVSPLAGFPGGVLLYAIIAVLLWPRRTPAVPQSRPASLATFSPLRRSGAALIWLVLWIAFAVESLLPADRTPGAVRDLISGMTDGEPGWMASINTSSARLIGGHGLGVSIGLAICFTAIGVSVLIPRLTRFGVLLAVVLSLVIWVVAQDFGEVFTGQATDLNSGLLLVLLAACYWPLSARSARTAAL